jgi:hypothetical protein
MSFVQKGHGPLNYNPVSYGGALLQFRGPAADLDGPYIVCLGGSETYGRFIHTPYAAMLNDRLAMPVVNLGVMNAGLDVMLQDEGIRSVVQGAAAVVLQITGAQNMTNRFYSVHPRRNDRFVKASGILRTIYRDVDFTEFHFTRHMLTHLANLSRDRFAILIGELQQAWLARMGHALKQIDVPVHLLWLSNRAPADLPDGAGIGRDPLFVTAAMLDEVARCAASLTLALPPDTWRNAPTRGMFFAAREETAARALPGPAVHSRAANLLAEVLGAKFT